MGTLPQIDLMWLCGMYLYLPPNWVGCCAAVVSSEHSYFVSASSHTGQRRRRRGVFKPQDCVWMLLKTTSYGPLVRRLSCLSSHPTLSIIRAEQKELRSLLAMTLQHCIVLTLMLLLGAGGCVLIGTSCCTYVTDNDEDGGVIQQAIANLTSLHNSVSDFKTDDLWLAHGTHYF